MNHRRIAGFLIVMLTAGCGSVGGLTGFPPGTSENTPPSVTTVAPPADGTAPADAPITVTFNKAMSPGGLEIAAEPPIVLGDPLWSDDGRTVTMRPTSPLSTGLIYTIRVRARDRQGNAMTSDHVWSFTAVAPSEVRGEGQLRLADRVDVGMDARVFTLFAALAAAAPEASLGEAGSVRAAVATRLRDLPSRVVDPVRRFLADTPAPVEHYVVALLSLSPPPEFRDASGVRAQSPAPGGTQAPSAQQGQRGGSPQPGQQQQPGARPSPAPRSTPGAQATPAPGSTRPIVDLGPMLAQFYAAAGLADLWRDAGKGYADALEAHRQQAPGLLGRAADYMRAATIPGGRIAIFPNLLGRPGQGYLVRQTGRAILVVSATPAVDRLALVRPFVQLVLDPVRGTGLDAVQRAEPLYAAVRETAARSGLQSWPDVVVESLFEAVAIRVALSGDEAQAALRAAYARGLILVDHFTTRLSEYEGGTTSLVDAFPGMVAAIDVDREQRRWLERRPN